MHALHSNFILGYHGCDREVGETLLCDHKVFEPSQNAYDWLGTGIYFWEVNPKRGFEFACESMKRKDPKIKDPFVIGAIIEPRLCLDLMTSSGIDMVRESYEFIQDAFEKSEFQLPENKLKEKKHFLDCLVINTVDDIRKDRDEPSIDTVKGLFIEGGPVYSESAFHEKSHIQICVRNPDCIKGVFRVDEVLWNPEGSGG